MTDQNATTQPAAPAETQEERLARARRIDQVREQTKRETEDLRRRLGRSGTGR